MARIKANHVYEDFDTGGNVFNARMKDTKELVQKNAEEIDAKMEELITARREDNTSAIEKL
ncbi:MAG: hypothetical protein LUC37_02980 [Prevotella sp.]|nr:hypothetical protein [Prevotella sp.]